VERPAKKINVVRIIARLNIGGPAIQTILLTRYLDANRFNATLVAGNITRTEGDMSYYARDNGVSVYSIPELGREISLFHDVISFLKILTCIRRKQAHIVHTHTAKAGTLGRLAVIAHNSLHRKNRVRLIHTFHGHVFNGYFGKWKTKLFILVERFLARRTDRIITISQTLKDELLELGIGTALTIEVIPLGFELAPFLSIPAPCTDNRPMRVGIIGRLVPIKNHRLFLKAAACFLKKEGVPNTRFFVVGDGELTDTLVQYAKDLGISNAITFTGWKQDLAEVYRGLDIVALTSINEGTPVSLIEAMASGRPVIATEVGGVVDLLGTNSGSHQNTISVRERGIGIQSQNADDFSNGLVLLANDRDLRKKLASRARDFAAHTFTRQRLVHDIELLYEKVREDAASKS